MFSIGDCVVCGNKGVCIVNEIRPLDISGAAKDEEYYILKSVYSAGSTVYIPVTVEDSSIRSVLSMTEAEALVKEIAGLPYLSIESEKLVEATYKAALRSNDARELVRLLKTIDKRSRERLAMGRKETSIDMKYHRMAADYLYGELAVSLSSTKTEMEELVLKEFHACDSAVV